MSTLPLSQAREVSLVGGKAVHLGKLLRFGIRVPDGFVITTETTENWDENATATALRHFDNLGVKYVAVRSSAVAEDNNGATWAGQFDTFLFIDRAQLINKIMRCINSAHSVRSISYGKQTNQSGQQKIAVVVQAMIPSEVSGVSFSVHPVTQNPDQMVIEAAFGLGEAVVSGEITPDNYVVSRKSHKIIRRSIVSQPKMYSFSENKQGATWQNVESPEFQKLNDTQILELAVTTEKLERHFDYAVDIEWAFYQHKLYILQSRPITTLR